ncbi:hypothetical protein GCM10025859_54780 [Alicyclobacillus fastidiosus]|nr:hypothetical protein GCM10025859_54780 [Alicyclobacillus fastidiosus]
MITQMHPTSAAMIAPSAVDVGIDRDSVAYCKGSYLFADGRNLAGQFMAQHTWCND